VLHDVPPHVTVAGVPAEVVGKPANPSPALDMDHSLDCGWDVARNRLAPVTVPLRREATVATVDCDSVRGVTIPSSAGFHRGNRESDRDRSAVVVRGPSDICASAHRCSGYAVGSTASG